MADLEAITSEFNREKAALIKFESKQKRKIERKRQAKIRGIKKTFEKKIARINEEYNRRIEEEEKKFQEQADKAAQNYYKNAAAYILSELDSHYKILQERSPLAELTESELSDAKECYKTLSGFETDSDREKGEELIRKAKGEKGKNFLDAIKLIREGSLEQNKIVSYIAYDEEKNICYVLSPVGDKENKKPADSLESKLFEIVGNGEVTEVTTGLSVKIDGEVVSSGANVSQIKFTSEPDFFNNYLFMIITPENYANVLNLKEALVSKLNELQPEDIKNIGLNHKIIEVEPLTLEHFKNHNREEILRQKEKIKAGYSERKSAGVGTPYKPMTLEEIRQRQGEALARLNSDKYVGKDILNLHEAAEVLGISYYRMHASLKLKKFNSVIKLGGRRKLFLRREEIEEFIQTHKHTGGGWKNYSPK